MAEDIVLNERLRDILRADSGIEERKMFGGVCFLHRGNMLCGCDSQHGLSVRVGPDQYDAVLRLKHAKEMDFTGRPLKGLVFVEPEGYRTKAMLRRWVDRGLRYTATLPRKSRRRRKQAMT